MAPGQEPQASGDDSPEQAVSDAVDEALADAEAQLAEDIERVEEEGAGIVDEMARVASERDEYLNSLQRLKADFDNYKKRVARQSDEQLERAAEGLVEKLIPVLDSVDAATAHDPDSAAAQVGAQLYAALEREGLERLDPEGKPFDPNEHEAVEHEPGDSDPTVVLTHRAGFRWKGRVLRPAMVKVAGS